MTPVTPITTKSASTVGLKITNKKIDYNTKPIDFKSSKLSQEQKFGYTEIQNEVKGIEDRKVTIPKFLNLGILRPGKENQIIGSLETGKECYIFNPAEYEKYLKYTTGDKHARPTFGDISKELGLQPGALREANHLKIQFMDPKYGSDVSQYPWDYDGFGSNRLVIPKQYVDPYVK